MKLIVDASVAIKWYVPEEHSLLALRLLDQGIGLAAPELIYAEIGNALWKKARRGELTRDEAKQILTRFEDLKLETYPLSALSPIAFTLATALDRSFYDSLYLALAIASDCAVITADRRFHDAVKASPLADHVRWIGEDR